jgi:MFS family permease
MGLDGDYRDGGNFLGLRGNALVMTATETFGQGILFLTSTFWALYVLELGASLAAIGILSLVQGLIRVLLQAPVGYISDRFGHKKLIVWGGLLASFAPLTYFLASDWVYLIPGVILEGFTNTVLPARQAMFASAVEPEKRATAFATFHTLFALASSVMPLLSGLLLDRMGLLGGMRLAFLVTGAVMLLASVGRALFLKESLVLEDRPQGEGFSFGRVVREMFEPVTRLRALRVAILGSFLFSLAVGILTRYSVVYAVDMLGLSKVEWGLVAGGIGFVGILTRIPVGRMVDRLSRRTSLLVSYTVRPLFILAFTFSTSFLMVLVVQTLDNIFGYVQQPTLEALVIDVTPAREIGRAYGAMNMIPGIALTVAPLLGAVIWESIGAAWAFYASALFSLTAALTIWTFLGEPKRDQGGLP